MNSNNDKKISQQQDLLKLIEIAKKEPKVAFKKDPISDFDDIRQFIADNNIRSHGTARIPAHLIYTRYVNWCRLNNVEPRKSVGFFKRFKKLFNTKTQNNLSYYLLYPEGWDMTFESLSLSREQYNAEKRRSKGQKS
jgi:hypothetical protein